MCDLDEMAATAAARLGRRAEQKMRDRLLTLIIFEQKQLFKHGFKKCSRTLWGTQVCFYFAVAQK